MDWDRDYVYADAIEVIFFGVGGQESRSGRDLEVGLGICLHRLRLAASEKSQVRLCRERVFVCCMHVLAVASR